MAKLLAIPAVYIYIYTNGRIYIYIHSGTPIHKGYDGSYILTGFGSKDIASCAKHHLNDSPCGHVRGGPCLFTTGRPEGVQ